MTNHEKIKNMTVIEMAKYLAETNLRTQYIGQIFNAEDNIVCDDGSIGVDFGDKNGFVKVYKGEYEIIEDIDKELLKFVSENCPEDMYYQDILDFILEHRAVLGDLLQ